MKSIKEKAEEYGYTNWQSDEYHDGASEGLEFDPIGHTQKTFEAGANYVLDIIEQALTPQKCLTDIGIDVSPEALIKTALQTIEALKKK